MGFTWGGGSHGRGTLGGTRDPVGGNPWDPKGSMEWKGHPRAPKRPHARECQGNPRDPMGVGPLGVQAGNKLYQFDKSIC